MKIKWYNSIYSVIFLLGIAPLACAQNTGQNWTKDQLLEPATLAAAMENGDTLPTIINVGPGAIIPHSLDAGAASEENGINKFNTIISKLPKNKRIVIYCGCCPYEHCPNIRPAIQALKNHHFTNYKLLDLPDNINKNWLAKGYPAK